MEIDNKLKKILNNFEDNAIHSDMHLASDDCSKEIGTDEAIAQIKQAFADEGYAKDLLQSPETPLMIGAEWNSAFEKELGRFPKTKSTTSHTGKTQTFDCLYSIDAIREAARKAAGL